MSLAESFPPIAAPDAKILILGSMPGRISLQHQQYYAHPRNAFWPIMARLFGAGPGVSYEHRCRVLVHHRIAVWDVLKRCWRPGSLDAAIDPQSVEVNDFQEFLAMHPNIRHVFFNGRKAEQTFHRYAAPGLDGLDLEMEALPSTSPAHAAMNLDEKCRAWSVLATGR